MLFTPGNKVFTAGPRNKWSYEDAKKTSNPGGIELANNLFKKLKGIKTIRATQCHGSFLTIDFNWELLEQWTCHDRDKTHESIFDCFNEYGH